MGVSERDRERAWKSEEMEPWGAESCGGSSASKEKELKWDKAKHRWGTNGFCSLPRDLLLLSTSHHYSSPVSNLFC